MPMKLPAPLLTRPVPLYVFLPIIVTCGVAGFVASTMQPGSTIPGASPDHSSADPGRGPFATSTVEGSPPIGEKQLSEESTPRRDAPTEEKNPPIASTPS